MHGTAAHKNVTFAAVHGERVARHAGINQACMLCAGRALTALYINKHVQQLVALCARQWPARERHNGNNSTPLTDSRLALFVAPKPAPHSSGCGDAIPRPSRRAACRASCPRTNANAGQQARTHQPAECCPLGIWTKRTPTCMHANARHGPLQLCDQRQGPDAEPHAQSCCVALHTAWMCMSAEEGSNSTPDHSACLHCSNGQKLPAVRTRVSHAGNQGQS